MLCALIPEDGATVGIEALDESIGGLVTVFSPWLWCVDLQHNACISWCVELSGSYNVQGRDEDFSLDFWVRKSVTNSR